MTDAIAETPHVSELDGFWERLAVAQSPMLFLDYDGTLAPFVVDRMQAFPLDGITETLRAIRAAGTELAVVTGRPIAELLKLLGDLAVPIAGSQGVEFRHPDGRWFTMLPTAAQCARLITAEAEALEFAPRDRVERKPASVALHTRGLTPPVADAMERAVCGLWTEGAADSGLECRSFLGGVELRLDDVTKGTAVRTLLEERPDVDIVVYIGDDPTDEDAFRALDGRGTSIRVGNTTTPTCADAMLMDVPDVRRFLVQWLETVRDQRARKES